MQNVVDIASRRKPSTSCPSRYYRIDDSSLTGVGSNLHKGDVCQIAVGLFRQGEIHALKTAGGHVFLRYVRKEGDTVELQSPNPDYSPVTVPATRFDIIGCAVAFFDGKTMQRIPPRPLVRAG